MLKKTEFNYYDTYVYVSHPPIINITNEEFYVGFSLEDPKTYDPFIDETIYFPKAYFKTGKSNGEKWVWTVKEVELERCKIEKFGSFYRDKFKNKTLNNLYCFKKVDETLIGHFTYDYYSFFFISFYPCINTTENNFKCKPVEAIDYYLKSTFVSLQLQDIELTPDNYNSPAMPRDQDIYFTIGKKLFQEIHIYYQIVNIETDLDILGFNQFSNSKKEQFLKYDYTNQMTNLLENNIYETGESFCDITIKLSEKILTERRTYTKLIEVLSNIGGFMGVILSLLKIISSFSISILYEISLVNNLFEFDINKKIIFIKNKSYNKLNTNFDLNGDKKENIEKSFQKVFQTNNRLHKESVINKSNENFLNTAIKKGTTSTKINNYINNNEQIFIRKNELVNNDVNVLEKRSNHSNNRLEKNENNSYFNINGMNVNKQFKENKNEKSLIIDRLTFNKICTLLGFLCIRKRKNLENILLDEGMRIISEKLDITNIFKKIYKNDEFEKKYQIIKMSDNCKKNLKDINK